jgi:hypothetical protein
MRLAFQMHFPCHLGFHWLLLFLFVSSQDNRLLLSPQILAALPESFIRFSKCNAVFVVLIVTTMY